MNADDKDLKKVIGEYPSVAFFANLRPMEMLSRNWRNEISRGGRMGR